MRPLTTLDKLGPMTRSVEDAMLVLKAICGPDQGDLASVPAKLDFDAGAPVRGFRIGYIPAWMQQSPATDVDRAALEMARSIARVGLALEKSAKVSCLRPPGF